MPPEIPKREVHYTYPCFFWLGVRRARIKRKLACITAVWPPAAEWSLSMMKHQTHSRPLITNGLTGNDDDNARVCTLSSIAISLLLTFMAGAGNFTSANSSLARPQTFLELSKNQWTLYPWLSWETEIPLAWRGSFCFLAVVSASLSHVFFFSCLNSSLTLSSFYFWSPFVLLLDRGPSLHPACRNTHVKTNTVSLLSENPREMATVAAGRSSTDLNPVTVDLIFFPPCHQTGH